MKERPDIAVKEDTEEMKRWRSLNQSEMDLCWKSLAEKNGRGSLDKVEESKRGALKGRGNLLERRRVRKNKRYNIRKWGEDCWVRIFSLFREYKLQRLQSKQEELAGRRGDEAAAKDGHHERSD